MADEALFKKLVDIGASGIAKAYERIAGIAPGVAQTNYFSGDITPVAQILPPPTAWDQFRLDHDIILRGVNGGGFVPVEIPLDSAPERMGFNFSDTILNGEFHEYRIGPPPPPEIWRIHGVNFNLGADATLTIQSTETVAFLDTGGVGITSSRYFGQNETGIFYPGPPATIVNVKAEPKPWDMTNNSDPLFRAFPRLLITIRNDRAVGDLNLTFHVVITRMNRATAPTPPR